MLQEVFIETIHSTGIFLMLFVVLPDLEPLVSCAAILNIVTIPVILRLVSSFQNQCCYHQRNDNNNERSLNNDTEQNIDNRNHSGIGGFIVNFFAILSHIGGFSLTCWYIDTSLYIWLIVASVCISFSWWENFKPNFYNLLHWLMCCCKIERSLKSKQNIVQRNSKILFVSMLWKICLSVCFPVLYAIVFCERGCMDDCLNVLFSKNSGEVNATGNPSIMTTILTHETVFEQCKTFGNLFPFLIALIYIVLNGICFKIGKAACKILAQKLAFGIPLTMATPISFILIYELSKKDSTVLFLLGSSKCKIDLTHWANENINNDSSWKLFVGGLLSFGSFCLTTSYIWIQKKERLQSTDT